MRGSGRPQVRGRRILPTRHCNAPPIESRAMLTLLVAFGVSLCLTLLTVAMARRYTHFLNDHDLSGPQKFHAHPVPRVGGIGIVLGAIAGGLVVVELDRAVGLQALMLLACGAPTFLAGLSEDITKRISPRRRLFFTAMSAALAVWLVEAVIARTAIPGLDWIVSVPVGAALVTVFVVAGVANSLNIIDGFNGLSSMCGVLILVCLCYVSALVGDTLVMQLALVGIGAIFGFFVWNFPAGLIFLGDGGAYFVGFYVAELAILLLHRNPQVSPMFPLLLCIYPVFETVFSIYRRKFLRDVSPGLPDGLHLHSLVYRRLMRWAVGNKSAKSLTRRNSMTSPYLWMLCMTAVVPAVLFWDNTPVLAGFILVFSVGYVVLYWRIVRFKSPRWLVYRRANRA